jgi:ribosomal protein L32
MEADTDNSSPQTAPQLEKVMLLRPRPTMNMQNSPPRPKRRRDDQATSSRKEICRRSFSDHVGQPKAVHEQVPKRKQSSTRQGGRRPHHRPAMKKAPEGAPHNTNCPHSEAKKPLTCANTVPEVGLEPAASPESPPVRRKPSQSGPVRCRYNRIRSPGCGHCPHPLF